MITRVKSARKLPDKLFVAVLLKNDMENIEEKFDDMEGYLLVTKSPKMTILFIEYNNDSYSRVSKEIWNHS